MNLPRYCLCDHIFLFWLLLNKPYFFESFLQKSNVNRIFVNSKGGDILSAIHIAEICHTPLIVIKAISSSAVMTLLIRPQFRFVLPSGFLFLHPLTCNKSCLNDEEFDFEQIQ